jgi:hypothetical protein
MMECSWGKGLLVSSSLLRFAGSSCPFLPCSSLLASSEVSSYHVLVSAEAASFPWNSFLLISVEFHSLPDSAHLTPFYFFIFIFYKKWDLLEKKERL